MEKKDTEPTNSEKLLISAGEAAALLDLSRTALYSGLSTGAIPPGVRIGGRRLWDPAELRAWVAAGCPRIEAWRAMRGRI